MSFRTPSYRLHKPSGQAVVTLNGRDCYLGKFGSAESKAEYDRLIAEWLANGRRLAGPEEPPADLTISEVLLAFWRHADAHYRTPSGGPARELENLRDALRPLRRLYGATTARAFGPKSLKAVRTALVEEGLARTTVNARINRIRRVFKWAASEELIPAQVHEGLKTVEGLLEGQSGVRESAPIEAVPIDHVEAVLPLLPPPVAAMVRLQLLTGCRAGEVMRMRGRDLKAGEPTWEYRPATHKNAWRGKKKVIPLGPRAQEIVKAALKPELTAYLFSPADAVAAHHAGRAGVRKSRPTPSELGKRCKDGPGRKHAARYDRRTYRQSIVRACDRAFPHPTIARVRLKEMTPEQGADLRAWRKAHRWSPLQLRHTAATLIRARYGLEAAQAVLGHAKADTTEIYAERDVAKVREIMVEIG